ncbi:unnamed protein product [Prorocentrum cordatum]|uniref:Uncharacterized protein n=1 Tax=Prorocentrum cordatum TaxID=2364126 RepID=A0ABN9TZ15_9DINO|nr:unnamed protein product [Polarella glacialis]
MPTLAVTDQSAAIFDGRWVDQEGGVVVIKGSELDVVGLGVYALEVLGPQRCGFWMDGDFFEAQMAPDGRLVWDDESIWVKSTPEAPGAVSPSQPGRIPSTPSAELRGSRDEAHVADEERPQRHAEREQRAAPGQPSSGAAAWPPAELPPAAGSPKGGCVLGPPRGAGAMMRETPASAPAARPAPRRPEAAPARPTPGGPRAPREQPQTALASEAPRDRRRAWRGSFGVAG